MGETGHSLDSGKQAATGPGPSRPQDHSLPSPTPFCRTHSSSQELPTSGGRFHVVYHGHLLSQLSGWNDKRREQVGTMGAALGLGTSGAYVTQKSVGEDQGQWCPPAVHPGLPLPASCHAAMLPMGGNQV